MTQHQMYDRDIHDIRVQFGKIFIELAAPMEEVILTKEDLMVLLAILVDVEEESV